MHKNPWFKFYANDFMSDEKVAECSPASIGVYIMVLCILHRSETYGRVALKDKYKDEEDICLAFAKQFAKLLPYSLPDIRLGLCELLRENVLQLRGQELGQKRMIKDGIISVKRSESGRIGGLSKSQAKVKQTPKQTSDSDSKESDKYSNSINNNINNTKKHIQEGGLLRGEFELFWKTYHEVLGRPKREKEAAWKKYKSLNTSERERAMSYIGTYKATLSDVKYAKYARTYLADKVFLDANDTCRASAITRTIGN